MPTRESAPVGAPCWIELFTSDADRARAFYDELFGWTSEEPNPEFGGYINFSRDGVRVAGAMANDGSQGAPDGWTIYLAVEDAAATADAAAAHGGTVHVPPADVGDLGRFAVLGDAAGAIVGIWQPRAHQGFGVLAEPGAPAWFELHARDYDADVQFYRDVFGWDTATASDEPQFRYTTLGDGDDALAGIMDAGPHPDLLPEGIAAHWAVYFGTDDVAKALEQVVELGGTVLRQPEDTPYGRLAEAADPTGARFKLVQG
jgi:predicted enzyme related to lactoylglutathione lyase